MSILDLPNEILLRVCQEVEEFADTFRNERFLTKDCVKTFLSLCLTCRQFNAVAQPLLYQIHSRGKPDIREATYHGCVHQNASRFFLRTLIVRPDLAASVSRSGASPMEEKH